MLRLHRLLNAAATVGLALAEPCGLFAGVGRQMLTANSRPLKPHNVVSTIDVDGFAGDARAGIGRKKYAGAADFADLPMPSSVWDG